MLRRFGVAEPRIVLRSGEPIRQILAETSANEYDLAIIGARRKGSGGMYWRPEKTYEVIKAVPPPVLVAIGATERISRILVCTGGKRYIDDAVQLAGQIATFVGATVTLLHVMAEPPAIYADLMRLEEDVDRLLASGSELGRGLRGQKESLEKMGIEVRVRIRHGLALDQIFDEVRDGEHDLIVTGTSQAKGTFRHYIMGDLTRGILNRADCPVLVARAGKIVDDDDAEGGFFHRLLHGFGAKSA
jgi:nucleotide-binding universal stress UspA family protein